MTNERFLRIDGRDNVLVALQDLKPGVVEADGVAIDVPQPVPQKHKFLTECLSKGDKIYMYGVPVGSANEDLPIGTMITIENVTHFADPISLDNRKKYEWQAPDVSAWEERTFQGYHRPDGKVGTANYWLFIPLVFCENRNLKAIEETLKSSLGYKKPNEYLQYAHELIGGVMEQEMPLRNRVFENVDGIKFLYHDGGCGGTRGDAETLLRLLAGYLQHPNVAGATVLSLGCQHAQVQWFQEIQEELYPQASKPVIYLEQQVIQSEEKLIKKAIADTIEQLKEANQIERKPAPLSKLVVGLECGGSDGFSGISANPAVGYASDLLVALGASTVLSEFPELNGVEQDIIDRCTADRVAEKFVDIQRAYEAQARAAGSGFDMNPSPGNIKDGLITDAIKSAGAAKKGGRAPVSDVLDYTEPVTRPGLNLLCTPGNDVESTTGLAGSGASIILFTTGLGTPTGNPLASVIKISSNTSLSERMSDIIDLDAGPITRGEKNIEQVGEEILEKIIAVASGEKTKAMDLEQNDFILWKRGVSL
ncbi:altronate hydrolase [Reichenbachiella agariperforans]|uniref:Altronate hydrolase n=1 Tax=Reichenbachiella agariperforans TaxID=156994 RepID=A0A1M6M208_REIAG|nr:altronate dehydratase family protein [Reichenbachiella agariperforans]SHJ77426.1 altronate hydrolase [Reichenbachiella agariperforans]